MTPLLDEQTDDQELRALIAAVCNGVASPVEQDRLEELLTDDEEAQMTYLLFAGVHAHFLWQYQGRTNEIANLAADTRTPTPSFGFLGEAYQGTVGYFSSGWPVAYLVATVILGVGLLVGGMMRVSTPVELAEQTAPKPSALVPSSSTKMEFVGRITGMIDCRWSDPNTAVPGPVAVPLGRKYALASGLMEITYNTGAKVILQGPCTYEVESKAGGYLSVGKLTARVEKKEERRKKNEELSDSRSSFLIPHSYFAVQTPTAVVTDLGTEFGVEVSKEGHTTSHVFQGTVRLEMASGGMVKENSAVVLHDNETARTERTVGTGGLEIAMRHVAIDPQCFVRQLVRPPQIIDLLDIVAGGYGRTQRRERGIDPSSGAEDPLFATQHRIGDGQYHPVAWHKFIDGVFIPNGKSGPVVVDSAGHTFDRCPRTSGTGFGSIWPRAANVNLDGTGKNDRYWVYAMGRGQQYMPGNSGLLCMHTNAGITFNLEAMRRVYRGTRPCRFRAMAALADAQGFVPESVVQLTHIWVLVDGQVRLSRPRLQVQDGPIKVDIELESEDRFLTLVSTDGGNDMHYDWVVFGDPVLETVLESERKAGSVRKIP